MRLIVHDRFTGKRKRYELEVFEENTVEDVINTLIETGHIRPEPEEGYEWILLDSNCVLIPNHELLFPRLYKIRGLFCLDEPTFRRLYESGEEVLLAARPGTKPQMKPQPRVVRVLERYSQDDLLDAQG